MERKCTGHDSQTLPSRLQMPVPLSICYFPIDLLFQEWETTIFSLTHTHTHTHTQTHTHTSLFHINLLLQEWEAAIRSGALKENALAIKATRKAALTSASRAAAAAAAAAATPAHPPQHTHGAAEEEDGSNVQVLFVVVQANMCVQGVFIAVEVIGIAASAASS